MPWHALMSSSHTRPCVGQLLSAPRTQQPAGPRRSCMGIEAGARVDARELRTAKHRHTCRITQLFSSYASFRSMEVLIDGNPSFTLGLPLLLQAGHLPRGDSASNKPWLKLDRPRQQDKTMVPHMKRKPRGLFSRLGTGQTRKTPAGSQSMISATTSDSLNILSLVAVALNNTTLPDTSLPEIH